VGQQAQGASALACLSLPPHSAWQTEDDDFLDDDDEPGAKKKPAAKAAKAAAPFTDTVIAEFAGKKRLTVGKYKGNVNVSLREFYEKDGEMLPGKKGISLTAEQWAAVVAAAPAVEAALAALA